MTAGDLLVLVATVIATADADVEIDRGLIDGVQPGDQARIFYELQVGNRPHRIEVGAAEVQSATQKRARLEVDGHVVVRPGYKAELRVPVERALTLLTRQQGHSAAAVGEPSPPRDLMVAPRPDLPRAEVIDVDGGRYEIGLSAEQATFYNHQPRFIIELEAFQLDQRPVYREEFERLFGSLDGSAPLFATEVTFDEAASYCRAIGRRLPTELEWEVGVSRLPLDRWPGIFEWTDAWYQPYPGNDRVEPEYGDTYRVLRGGPDSGSDRNYRRRYMEPIARDERLGFRCAGGGARSR